MIVYIYLGDYMGYIFMSVMVMLGAIIFITHTSLKRLNSGDELTKQK